MDSEKEAKSSNVSEFKSASGRKSISKEFERLLEQLHAEFPEAESISFEYLKDLRLHVDVRTLEEAYVIEARLPTLCGGLFSQIFCGSSPHHPFFHRVSARVDR